MAELITDGAFNRPEGTEDTFEEWDAGNEKGPSFYPPRRVEVEGRSGFAAWFCDGGQYIEQDVAGYAWDELHLWVGSNQRESCLVEVLLWYENRNSPDIEPCPMGPTVGQEIIWKHFSVPTRRCSKLVKIRIRNQRWPTFPHVDDVSLEGGENPHCPKAVISTEMQVPSWQRPPYVLLPLSPVGQPYPAEKPEMPTEPPESIFSEIEFRLRSIEKQLKDIKCIELDRLNRKVTTSQKQEQGKPPKN